MAEIVQPATWLTPRGGSPAESYAKGYALGQQERESRRQAAIQAQGQAQRMAIAQQELAQRALEQKARNEAVQAELAMEVKKQEEAAAVAREELQIKKSLQAMKDREAAMRFSATEAIQQDLASGIPAEQAFMRNAGFFVSDPAAMASTMRTLQPPPVPTVREFPGTDIPAGVQTGNRMQWPPGAGAAAGQELFSVRDVTDDAGNVIGRGVVTGPRSGTFRENKPAAPDFIERGMAGAAFARLKKNEADLADAEKNLPMLSKSPRMKAMTEANIDRLRKQIAADKAEIQAMRKSGAAASPMGAQTNREDVKKEALELIKKYPSRAAAIRKRYQDTFGEALP